MLIAFFMVSLPLPDRASTAGNTLAEDNSINREIATIILTDMGFRIDTAEDGDIAVKKLVSQEPGYYQAILMDIQMPVMDGYDDINALQKTLKEVLYGA